MNLKAERTQFFRDEGSGFPLLEAEFRVGMDAVTPAYDFGRQDGDRIVRQHGILRWFKTGFRWVQVSLSSSPMMAA
jgi:hypothetical protein